MSDEIAQCGLHVNWCLESPEDVDGRQRFLFNSILRTKNNKTRSAANAATILKLTGYSFSHSNWEDVNLSYADLSHSILEEVNLRGANLEQANFIQAYLSRARLRGANLEGIQLGAHPSLLHAGMSVIILYQSKNKLMTADSQWLYLWNLTTLKLEQKAEFQISYIGIDDIQILFFKEDTHFLMIRKGRVEIWETKTLSKRGELIEKFEGTINLSDDEKYLITYEEKYSYPTLHDPEYYTTTIRVWEIIHKNLKESSLDLTLRGSKQIAGPGTIRVVLSTHLALLSAYEAHTITYFDFPSLEEKERWTNIERMSSLSMHHDGKLLFDHIPHAHWWNTWNYEKRILKLQDMKDHPVCANQGEISYFQYIQGKKLFVYKFREKAGNQEYLCFREEEDNQIVALFPLKCGYKPLIFTDELILGVAEGLFGSKIDVLKLDPILLSSGVQLPLKINELGFSLDSASITIFNQDEFEFKTYAAATGELLVSKKFQELRATYPPLYGKGNYTADPNRDPDNYFCSTDKRYFIHGTLDRSKSNEHFQNPWKEVHIMCVEDGIECCQFNGLFLKVALSGDNHTAALINFDGQVEIWQVLPSKVLLTSFSLPHFSPKTAYNLLISHSFATVGYIAIADKNEIKVWKYFNRTIQKLPQAFSHAYRHCDIRLSFTHNDHLIIKEWNKIIRWDLNSDKKNDFKLLSKAVDYARFFDTSADGSLLMYNRIVGEDPGVYYRKSTMALADFETGKILYQRPINQRGFNVCLSPNGQFCVLWSDTMLYVWKINQEKFQLIWRFPLELEVDDLEIDETPTLNDESRQLINQLQNDPYRHF